MSEIKTQPAVVAEFRVILPDGRSFEVVNMTLQFCATVEVAKERAKEIGQDFVIGLPGEHVDCLKRIHSALLETVASGCKVKLKTAGFMVRLTDKPNLNDGWGK